MQVTNSGWWNFAGHGFEILKDELLFAKRIEPPTFNSARALRKIGFDDQQVF
jgi:hypothetical protein